MKVPGAGCRLPVIWALVRHGYAKRLTRRVEVHEANRPADTTRTLQPHLEMNTEQAAVLAEINAALADPGIVARLASLGATVLASSPAGSATFIDEETEKWRKVVKFSGAKSN